MVAALAQEATDPGPGPLLQKQFLYVSLTSEHSVQVRHYPVLFLLFGGKDISD